jgi:ferredoxin-type protein NapH
MWKVNPRRFIQVIRHVSQAVFFALFVFLIVGSVCSFLVGGFKFIEPLGGVQILLSSVFGTTLRIVLTIASGLLASFLITILVGRAWCGWACPIGSIVELGEYVFSKAKLKSYAKVSQDKRKILSKNFRHAVLGGVVSSALISRNPAWCEVCPIGTICRATGASGFVAVAETAILGSVVSSSLYEKRFFCKYLCPIGSLLTIISKLNVFVKPVVNKESCRECRVCERICPEAIPLYKEEELVECTKCLECYSRCPYNAVSIKIVGSVKPSRKKIVALAVAVLFIISLLPFSYLYTSPVTTMLTIYPGNFTVAPSEEIALTVTLSSHGEPIQGREIFWWASEGSFNRNNGYIVNFTAPSSAENKTITIKAFFYGDEEYLPSNASIIGEVIYIKKESTRISIKPSSFVVKPGGNVSLEVETSPRDLPDELIKWVLDGPGRLSGNVGRVVVYYPPEEVEKEVRVNITAIFEGSRRYLPSRAQVSGYVIPKHLEKVETVLLVEPSNFTVRQGERVRLRAELKTVGGEEVEGVIRWRLEGAGGLSATVGPEVIYTAPETVTGVGYVKITAYFEGDEKHIPSEASASGLIVGGAGVRELFEVRFGKAVFEDAMLTGSVRVGNLTVVTLKVKQVVFEDLNMPVLGLTSRRAVLNCSELGLTYLSGEVDGRAVDLESLREVVGRKSFVVTDGVMFSTKLSSTEARFVGLTVLGEYVGGDEPYMPVIILGRDIALSSGYSLEAPKTYKELTNKVMELKTGRMDAKNFSIIKPASYQLDRASKKYQYSPRLLINSSMVSGENVTFYSIYYRVVLRIYTLGEYVVEATGDVDISRVVLHLWFGQAIGGMYCHLIITGNVHAVYLEVEDFVVKDLLISLISS